MNGKSKARGFVWQTLLEIKNLLRSKLNIILAALILLGAIAFPIISLIRSNSTNNMMRYYPEYGMEDIVVDGVTISSENPMFWEIREIVDRKEQMESMASTKGDDLALEFYDTMLEGMLKVATVVTSYEDYRMDLSWQRRMAVSSKFIYEHLDAEEEDLREAVSFFMYFDEKEFKDDYLSLSQIEVLAKIDEFEQKITRIDKIILENDYIEYYNFQIDSRKEDLAESQKRIEALEKDIIENPLNEEMYNEQIEGIKRNIRITEEIEIPSFQYRIDKNIDPSSDDWRRVAMDQKVNYLRDIEYNELLSEEDFEKEEWLKQEFKTYIAYKQNWQRELDKKTEKVYVAERSLETDKPDMDFIVNGTRSKKVGFLWYSLLLAVLATIVGGSVIAKEYQSGTIRLLLIRPKTRTKVVLSKFFAMLVICFALYAAADLLNLVTNGIVFGFGDYGFPNYTISSGANGVSFFMYYIPKFFVCAITVLFMGALSFFLSSSTRNTALSVAIPLVVFAGSLILMEYVSYRQNMQWLAYTPLAYINFAKYFTMNNVYADFEPIMGLGVPMMLGLSALFVFLGVLITNKRDVTN